MEVAIFKLSAKFHVHIVYDGLWMFMNKLTKNWTYHSSSQNFFRQDGKSWTAPHRPTHTCCPWIDRCSQTSFDDTQIPELVFILVFEDTNQIPIAPAMRMLTCCPWIANTCSVTGIQAYAYICLKLFEDTKTAGFQFLCVRHALLFHLVNLT